MKNLKKLSRSELKSVKGGEPGLWACCNLRGQCSSTVVGNSDNLYCSDPGTFLVDKLKQLTSSIS